MSCRLCGDPNVYDINSHFTPRAISQTSFGKGDHEEIHTIDLNAGTIDVYYGRAHPDAKPNIIKPLPNTAKGVFCKKCENGFGLVESICQPLLKKAVIDLAEGKLQITKMERGLVGYTLPVHSNIFNLFFLTVIWRQCVLNERESGNLILPEAEVDRLQNSLLAEIHKSKRQIEDSSDFKNYPLVTIFTARNRLETSGFVNPSGIVTNPDIFFIGDFSCLFFKEQPITPNLFKFLGIPYSLQMLSRDKSAHTTSRVIVIEEYLYNDISKLSIKYSVNTFFDIQIQKIAQHRGVGVLTAEYLLKKTAMRYFIQNGMKDYTTCVMDAAQFLCF